ncbi:4277_t:CDS:1, partial [Cetraspora pellucida]
NGLAAMHSAIITKLDLSLFYKNKDFMVALAVQEPSSCFWFIAVITVQEL